MKRFLILIVLMLVGCAGRSFNPKATMCIDPAFSEEQYQDFLDAGQEWHEKTSGDVDFQFRSGTGCEVDITASPHLRQDNDDVALGMTDAWFQWIKINTDDSWIGKNYIYSVKDYSLREVMLHEMGHYLTGGKHSPTRGDIMFAKGETLVKRVNGELVPREPRHLTEADLSRWIGKNHSYNQESDPYPAEVIEPE